MAKKKTTTTTTVTTTTTTVTNTTPKEIVDAFIIDRSGSMSSIWDSTINGVNEYLADSKRTATEQKVKSTLSTIWFDSEIIEHLVDVNVHDIEPFSKTEFAPRGSTALNDAIARMIRNLKQRLGSKVNDPNVDVTLSIFTDGQENASQEFRGVGNPQLVAMLRDVQDRLGWTVSYTGAGEIQAVQQVADSYGFHASNVKAYSHNPVAAAAAFSDISRARGVKSAAFATTGVKMNTGYFTNTTDHSPTVDNTSTVDTNIKSGTTTDDLS